MSNQESLSVSEAVSQLMDNQQEEKGSLEENEEVSSQEDNQTPEDQEEETVLLDSDQEDNEETVTEEDQEETLDEDDQDYVELASGDKITLQELLDGYERQSDYTRKTQAVAEQRKEIEAKQVEISEKLSAFDSKTSELNSLMEYLLGEDKKQEVDLLQLAEEDPSEYIRQSALMQAKQQKRDEAKVKIEEAQKLLQEEQSKEYQKYLEGEVEQLYTKLPSWSDDTVRQTSQSKILKAAQDKYGFKPEELQISDHRLWLLLKDAVAGAEIQDKKSVVKKKLAKAPKLLKAKGEKPKSQVKTENIQARKSKLTSLKGRDALKEAARLINDMGAI